MSNSKKSLLAENETGDYSIVTSEPTEKARVKLIAEHTHQGNACLIGDVIDVRPDQRDRLLAAKRAVDA